MASSDTLGVGLGLLRFNTTSTMDGSSEFQQEIKAGWEHDMMSVMDFWDFHAVNMWIGATGTDQDPSSSAAIWSNWAGEWDSFCSCARLHEFVCMFCAYASYFVLKLFLVQSVDMCGGRPSVFCRSKRRTPCAWKCTCCLSQYLTSVVWDHVWWPCGCWHVWNQLGLSCRTSWWGRWDPAGGRLVWWCRCIVCVVCMFNMCMYFLFNLFRLQETQETAVDPVNGDQDMVCLCAPCVP